MGAEGLCPNVVVDRAAVGLLALSESNGIELRSFTPASCTATSGGTVLFPEWSLRITSSNSLPGVLSST